MIEVGDTVEKIATPTALIKSGDRVIVIGLPDNGFVLFSDMEGNKIPGFYCLENYKKVKGAEMNNIEQLEKDYATLGETIAKLKAKPVWCEDDIEFGLKVYDEFGEVKEVASSNYHASYNLITKGADNVAFIELESNVTSEEMVDYLNKNEYTKEA